MNHLLSRDACASRAWIGSIVLTVVLAGATPTLADSETLPASEAPAPASGESEASSRDGFETNAPWMLTERMVRLENAGHNVIRSGPGEGYAVLRVAAEGSSYLVLAKKDEWYNVRLSETDTGWIHESLCREFGDMSGLEFRPNPRLFSRIGSFTFTNYAGGYSFDRKSNSFVAGARLGYYVFDFLEFEGGLSWTHVSRPAEIVESLFGLSLEEENFHMLFYELNGNVKLLPGRQLVPYVTVGLGSSILRGKTEPSFNYGGGIHFYVKKRVAFRWEFRDYRFEAGTGSARRTNHNFAFNVGTTFLL